MAWLRLSLTTHSEVVESAIDLLERFDATAVSVSAANDEALFAEGVVEKTDYWHESHISALLHPDIELDIVIASLRNLLGEDKLIHHQIEKVPDKNWIAEFKAAHGALVISDKLCICPAWERPPATDLITIKLDPGLAFGTGTHPTTRLCLEWLASHDIAEKSLLDYGCGSGVLAMAAAKLGVTKVSAVDIDPQAVLACQENVNDNNLQRQICVCHVDDFAVHGNDILVANILSAPLLALAQTFAACVHQGGQIVLSGLLAVQADACIEHYSRWFVMQKPIFFDEWAMLSGIRKQI